MAISESYVNMSRFSKENFIRIIRQIEKMEQNNENIWVPIGILEIMYDDDCAWIDEYFNIIPELRDVNILWNKIQMHLIER